MTKLTTENPTKYDATYRMGDMFLAENGTTILLLVQVGSGLFCLIPLQGGNRYRDPVPLEGITFSLPTVESLGYGKLTPISKAHLVVTL